MSVDIYTNSKAMAVSNHCLFEMKCELEDSILEMFKNNEDIDEYGVTRFNYSNPEGEIFSTEDVKLMYDTFKKIKVKESPYKGRINELIELFEYAANNNQEVYLE